MAARPTWKGYLKISLVNIPVRVFPATDSAATVSFNQLHRECGSRIQQKKWCPTCQTEGRLHADRGLSRLLKEDWPRSLDEWEERMGKPA